MNAGEVIALVAAVGTTIGAVAVWAKGRGENRNKAAEVYSAAEEMIANRVRADLETYLERLTAAEGRIGDLEERHRADSRQKAEMIRHIVALESLIPNPPGPPARPEWNIETE